MKRFISKDSSNLKSKMLFARRQKIPYSSSKSLGDEAAFARRSEGVQRSTSSKASKNNAVYE